MKKIIKHLQSPKWQYIIWPYLVLLVLHIIFVAQAQQPWLWPDEFIQLGHARYFSGGEHMSLFVGHPYGYFGYALLIFPAFWLFSEPSAIYQTIVIINAILASALYFPLYYILRQLFSLDNKTTTVIALIACFYPAFVAQSMIAFQDAVIFTFYATSVALLSYFLKKPNYTNIILFSSSVGFLYMMHIRALPILIITILFLLLLSIYRKKLRTMIILGVIILLGFFALTDFVNNHMMAIAWGGNLASYSMPSMLDRLTTLAGIKIVLSRALGQLLYLIEATYGLFFFGLIYLIQYIWQNKKDSFQETFKDARVLGLVYALLTSLGVFFASVLFLSKPIVARDDILIYGRYNELFLPIFIILGIVSFYFKANNKWHYFIITTFVFAVSFLVHQESLIVLGLPTPNNISGMALWVFLFYSLNILATSAIVLACFLILIKAFAKKFIYGIFILFILFGMNIVAYYTSYGDLNKHYLLYNNLLTELKDLKSKEIYYISGNACKDFDLETSDFFMHYNRYNYDWQIPETKFNFVEDQITEEPQYEYVVSSACWVPPEGVQVELVQKDSLGIQAIWKIIK